MKNTITKQCPWEKFCCNKKPFINHSKPQTVVFFDVGPKGFEQSIGARDYSRQVNIPIYETQYPTCSEREVLYKNCVRAQEKFWTLYWKLLSFSALNEDEYILLQQMKKIIDISHPFNSIRIQLSNLGFSGKK